MKLFVLKARRDLPDKEDPFDYDMHWGFVIRAKNSEKARIIAAEGCIPGAANQYWLNEKYTTCEEITLSGEPEIILEDYHAG